VNSSLDNLHDIVLPDPAAWTPHTIGWWILLVLIVLLGAGLAITVRRHRRANRYRRQALIELGRIETALADPGARSQALGELPVLVKRTALAGYPRETVASLTGEPWLRFLDESYGGNGFTTGPGRVLASIAYATDEKSSALAGDTLRELTALLHQWIRRHRV
jgi:hypothetical protein